MTFGISISRSIMIDLKLKPHSASRESSQRPFMSLLGGWGLREGS